MLLFGQIAVMVLVVLVLGYYIGNFERRISKIKEQQKCIETRIAQGCSRCREMVNGDERAQN